MKKKKLQKGFRYSVITLGCVILTAVIVVFAAVIYILQPMTTPEQAREVRLEIPTGTSIREVAHRLKEEGLIRSEWGFYAAARYPAVTGRTNAFVLKSGLYVLQSSLSIADMLSALEAGQQAYIRAVFPEGLTITKIAGILEEDGICASEAFVAAAHNETLLTEYAIPATSFEGYLFPDTYFFIPGMSGESVLRMMVDNFFSHVATIDSLREKSAAELFSVLTLASIVEREYRVSSEAPLIASVFTNRIREGIGLYSCATIEYIITEIQGKPHPDVITYADLQLESPYNTYKWRGLPPAPISNPGMVALKAAANPPASEYYFFRLTDAEAGTHTFTKTFDAHTEAGIAYRTKKAAAR